MLEVGKYAYSSASPVHKGQPARQHHEFQMGRQALIRFYRQCGEQVVLLGGASHESLLVSAA